MAINGTTPDNPLSKVIDARENAWMMEQEREQEEDTGEKGPALPCPDALWIGHYKAIADIVGVRDWRVWLGITAALSARAHRNVHVNYYSDLFGQGYWLLVSGSSTGKSLMTRLCSDLLPHDYRRKYSIESGQGLLNIIAESIKDKAGKTIGLQSVPTVLLLSEWTSLLGNMDIRGSTLLEKLNECYDSEHPVEVNRTEKQGHSDSLSVADPTLTILGATTGEGFRKRVQERHKESGFLNRHFILPGPSTAWGYNSKAEIWPRDQLIYYAHQELPRAHTLGLGQAMSTLYEPDAYKLDDIWGRAVLEPLHNGSREDIADSSPYRRLHAYARRIALLYAWSDLSPLITVAHAEAAHAAVECSLAYLRWLLNEATVELPSWQRAVNEVEEKIVRKIKGTPGIRKDDVCKALRKNGGYPAIAERIDKLVKSGAITLRMEGQKKCLYLVS
jgi:hypothetical protein